MTIASLFRNCSSLLVDEATFLPFTNCYKLLLDVDSVLPLFIEGCFDFRAETKRVKFAFQSLCIEFDKTCA